MLILKQGIDIQAVNAVVPIGMTIAEGVFELHRADCVVTSVVREVKDKFSLHQRGQGRAFDCRTLFRSQVGEEVWHRLVHHCTRDELRELVQHVDDEMAHSLAVASPGWDWVLETHQSDPNRWHHHGEYDPK